LHIVSWNASGRMMTFGPGAQTPDAESAADALLELLVLLKARSYDFVTVTPATHARVLAQAGRSEAQSIEDVLGWSLPFKRGLLPCDIRDCLREAGALESEGDLLRCSLRVSSLRGDLYLHSAYPTASDDAVFFGPDSYRFANLIVAEFERSPPARAARIIDVGAGAGVGGIVAASLCPDAAISLTDVNGRALALAKVNAAAAQVSLELVEADAFEGVEGLFDVVLINPPYIIDDEGRAYRDGKGLHGGGLTLDLAQAAMRKLMPGGSLILYTGSAIIAGRDRLKALLNEVAESRRCSVTYREIDPDVFGEELERPQYRGVDRIALVAATITSSG
jgi:methylase of polypeptide subunit release factors